MYRPFHQGSLQEKSLTPEPVSCLAFLFLKSMPRAGCLQEAAGTETMGWNRAGRFGAEGQMNMEKLKGPVIGWDIGTSVN